MLASVSNEGTLVYREGTRGTFSSLVWLDRNGIGMQVIRDRELFDDFALSHDGKRLAYTVNSAGQGATDLWVHDLVRGSSSRLTFEEGSEDYPVWSRDDRFVYYSSDRRNDGTIFRRASDGTGRAEEIGTTDGGDLADGRLARRPVARGRSRRRRSRAAIFSASIWRRRRSRRS